MNSNIISGYPYWTAEIYNKDSGQDYLGLRAVQGRMTDYLMPGIITITPRARYFSFYSWVLMEYSRQHPEGWSLKRFMRRREQLFILANIAFASTEQSGQIPLGLAGSDKLSAHWNKYKEYESIPLVAEEVENYLAASYGGYDAYRGVMTTLGILHTPEDGSESLQLFPTCQTLANAFEQSISATEYYQKRNEYDLALSVPRSLLIQYGSRCSLDLLASMPDRDAICDLLFALDATTRLAPSDSELGTRGNMTGTLGMILDMLARSTVAVDDTQFREFMVSRMITPHTHPSQRFVLMFSIGRCFSCANTMFMRSMPYGTIFCTGYNEKGRNRLMRLPSTYAYISISARLPMSFTPSCLN
jgi:hypothetical protein